VKFADIEVGWDLIAIKSHLKLNPDCYNITKWRFKSTSSGFHKKPLKAKMPPFGGK